MKALSCLLTMTMVAFAAPVAAQVSDQREDASSARHDAMFGMPTLYPTTPPTNLFATQPGQEQQVRRSQFTINGLAPLFFNSNADFAPSGGTNSAEFSPIVGASWSTPVFDLPFRFTASARAEVDRFTQAPTFDFDKLAVAGRLQYVDPTNDQAYSPYVSYAPRWDFAPFYKSWLGTRQDINFGVNKTFNYDANFQRVAFAGNTLAETAWSFGMTVAFQRRFREPLPGSWAVFVVPSVTYVIAPQWIVSLGLDLERRAFDTRNTFTQEDWFIEPILTLEFVLPERWFGSAANAAAFGRPALDFQVAYEKNWSNSPIDNYDAWTVGAALKLGWRF
jgi:hypothetical protein